MSLLYVSCTFFMLVHLQTPCWLTRFGHKMGQIGPRWDKSGTFSIQITVHLAQRAKMYWNLTHKFGGSKFDIRERTIEMDFVNFNFQIKVWIFRDLCLHTGQNLCNLFIFVLIILHFAMVDFVTQEWRAGSITADSSLRSRAAQLTHLHTDSTFTNSC